MMRRWVARGLWALGVTAVVGVAWWEARAGRAAPLPRYGQVPSYELLDDDGRPFDPLMLRGEVWISDFIFTRCAGQCPMLTDRLAHLATRLGDQSRLRFVSFTVDPAWDTPQRLQEYAKRYRATDGAVPWSFVTGPQEQLWRLSREGFHLGVERQPEAAAEPILHSVRLVLVDAQGAIRGYYDGTDEQQVRQLEHAARRLLAEAPARAHDR